MVSSVSCLYGMADPRAFGSNVIHLKKGMKINRNQLLRRLVDALYANNEFEFKRGCFRAKGETVDIFPAIETFDGVAYREDGNRTPPKSASGRGRPRTLRGFEESSRATRQ